MHRTNRFLSLVFAVLLILSLSVPAFAGGEPDDPEQTAFTITAETNRLRKKKTLQLYADTDEQLTWTSSDEKVATVNVDGLVTGVKVGHAHIRAKSEKTGCEQEFTVYVVRADMPWRKLLENNAVLGYRYSFEDDFYYTDDLNCWQKFFGFNYAYDMIAPLILFEYDFERILFTYGGEDWMIQLWKGQYGMVFYGSEVGVYTKPEGARSASAFAHYAAASEEDFLKIGTELYRENFSTGEYELEFITPYADHWWATGFVPGHLWDTTPCDELRLVTHITLKDAEMAQAFCRGLGDAGFVEVRDPESVGTDCFYRDGADVYLKWQDLSQAVNSHLVQASFWGVVGLNGLMLLMFVLFMLLIFGGLGAILLLILI